MKADNPIESAVDSRPPRRRRRPTDEAADGPAVILLAEDDHDMRELIAGALRRSGYEVIEARDGSELLELIGNAHLRTRGPGTAPDLIISDIRMPRWSGIEILAGLRRSDWAMPVVLITAFGDEPLHEEARRLGAVTVLDKPFDVDELIAIANGVVPPKFASSR